MNYGNIKPQWAELNLRQASLEGIWVQISSPTWDGVFELALKQ